MFCFHHRQISSHPPLHPLSPLHPCTSRGLSAVRQSTDRRHSMRQKLLYLTSGEARAGYLRTLDIAFSNRGRAELTNTP